jgi:septal ring factor EnvC (AmiA/AmiB activator)
VNRYIIFLSIFALIFCAVYLYAQDIEVRKGLQIKPGMEIVKMGDAEVVVPKGATVTKQDGMIVVEDIAQYVGRRFELVEGRLSKLDTRQEGLRKEVKQLREDLQKVIDRLKEASDHLAL